MIFLSTLLFIGQGAFSGGPLSVANIWFAPLSIFILLTLGRRITFIWIGGIALRGLVLGILKHQLGITLPNFQNPDTSEVT